MGLSYDFSAVVNHEELCIDRFTKESLPEEFEEFRPRTKEEEEAMWSEPDGDGRRHRTINAAPNQWRHPLDDDGEVDTGQLVRINPVTDALIYLLWFTKSGRITAKNYKEVFERIWIWEETGNAILSIDGKKRPIMLADVQRHIGLSTNNNFDKRTVFKKQFWESLVQRANYARREQEREMVSKAEVAS